LKAKASKGTSNVHKVAPKVASLFAAKSIYDVATAIANGASVHELSEGTTPLFEASKNGYVEVVNLFIHLGAAVNDELPWKVTPKTEEDYKLTNSSHLPNIAGIASATALTLAVHHNHINVVQLLLREGAKVHDRDLALATIPAIYEMLNNSKGSLDPGGDVRPRPHADPPGDDGGNPTALTSSVPKTNAGSGDPSLC
jgi:hypothetical protein